MFTQAKQDIPLSDRRIRYAVSVRIALAITLFFSAAWSLLQWTLATEQRFMAEGVAREFVQFEAMACAIIAACGVLHMAASGLGWISTVVKMRRQSAGSNARPVITHSASRVGALG